MGMGYRPISYFTLALAAALPLAQAESFKAQPPQAEYSKGAAAFFAGSSSTGSLPDKPAATDAAAAGASPGVINLGQSQALQELYAGVVLNQTITLVGQDFYQYFVAAWRDKPLSERYVLSVHERPSARLGSQIWVEYANRRVFQTFLPPARVRAKDAGLDAVEVAYQNIVDADVINLLFRDPDLGPDELKN